MNQSSVAIAGRKDALVYAPVAEFTKTVANSGTPEALSSTALYFRRATVLGKKAARTNNTGLAYLGTSGTNDSQAYEIGSGAEITIDAPVGCKFNFQDWYLDVATNGDGVHIIYS